MCDDAKFQKVCFGQLWLPEPVEAFQGLPERGPERKPPLHISEVHVACYARRLLVTFASDFILSCRSSSGSRVSNALSGGGPAAWAESPREAFGGPSGSVALFALSFLQVAEQDALRQEVS